MVNCCLLKLVLSKGISGKYDTSLHLDTKLIYFNTPSKQNFLILNTLSYITVLIFSSILK